jgi:hypothetical protein
MKQLSYRSGLPWYYVLGGSVPPLKAIRSEVIESGYKGYLADEITEIGRKPEPQKSKAANVMRQRVLGGQRKDISRYRACARNLHAFRLKHPVSEKCEGVHVAMSLKRNHIYNGLAHLAALDDLPVQLELFEV